MWIKIYANGQRTRSSASCSTCRKAEKRFGAIGIWNSPHAIK
jgi:arsenate reductase-like glutaredoxin family protein